MRTPGFYKKYGYALTERPAVKAQPVYRMRANVNTPPPSDAKKIVVVVPPPSSLGLRSLGRR